MLVGHHFGSVSEQVGGATEPARGGFVDAPVATGLDEVLERRPGVLTPTGGDRPECTVADGRSATVADVRTTVNRLRTAFSDLGLRSRRDRERPPTAPSTPDSVLAELTERQREVIEAAYRAGYFEWPCDTTAEGIAPELGITPATLHGQLRKAERRVLAELFD